MGRERFLRASGQALVEFTLTVPIFLMLIAICVDFGRAYYFDLSIRDAAFAAARYAGMNPNDDSGISAAAVGSAPAGVLTSANVSVSARAAGCSCRAGGTAVTVTTTYKFVPLTPLAGYFVGSSLTFTRSQTDIIK
jgi:Flp pilus assembly protein TadG